MLTRTLNQIALSRVLGLVTELYSALAPSLELYILRKTNDATVRACMDIDRHCVTYRPYNVRICNLSNVSGLAGEFSRNE
jgi:hypothetical protein